MFTHHEDILSPQLPIRTYPKTYLKTNQPFMTSLRNTITQYLSTMPCLVKGGTPMRLICTIRDSK